VLWIEHCALCERNGFIVESEDPVDIFMVRPPVDGFR
jgi:hypothetical protein